MLFEMLKKKMSSREAGIAFQLTFGSFARQFWSILFNLNHFQVVVRNTSIIISIITEHFQSRYECNLNLEHATRNNLIIRNKNMSK